MGAFATLWVTWVAGTAATVVEGGEWRGNRFLGISAISELVRLAGATSVARGITAGSAAMIG